MPYDDDLDDAERPVLEQAWERKLSMKSGATQKAYRFHIEEFQKVKGTGSKFTQDDIDDYFAKKMREDKARPFAKRESTGTKKMRKFALKYLLVTTLRLNIDFKQYSVKSER